MQPFPRLLISLWTTATVYGLRHVTIGSAHRRQISLVGAKPPQATIQKAPQEVAANPQAIKKWVAKKGAGADLGKQISLLFADSPPSDNVARKAQLKVFWEREQKHLTPTHAVMLMHKCSKERFDITTAVALTSITEILSRKNSFRAHLSPSEIAQALYGLRVISPFALGLATYLLAVADAVNNCEGAFNGQEIGNTLYGLQKLSCGRGRGGVGEEDDSSVDSLTVFGAVDTDSDSGSSSRGGGNEVQQQQQKRRSKKKSSVAEAVRTLLVALAVKFQASSRAEMSGQEISNALYGLRKMSSDSAEVCAILDALIGRLHFSSINPPVFTAQSISSAMNGLQGMSSNCTQVIELIRLLTPKFMDSLDKFSSRTIGSVMMGFYCMSSEKLEIQTLLEVLVEKIEESEEQLSDVTLSSVFSGMRYFNDEQEVVRELLRVLTAKISLPTGADGGLQQREIEPAVVSRMVAGLRNMRGQSEELRGLLGAIGERMYGVAAVDVPLLLRDTPTSLPSSQSSPFPLPPPIDKSAVDVSSANDVVGSTAEDIAQSSQGMALLNMEEAEGKTAIGLLDANGVERETDRAAERDTQGRPLTAEKAWAPSLLIKPMFLVDNDLNTGTRIAETDGGEAVVDAAKATAASTEAAGVTSSAAESVASPLRSETNTDKQQQEQQKQQQQHQRKSPLKQQQVSLTQSRAGNGARRVSSADIGNTLYGLQSIDPARCPEVRVVLSKVAGWMGVDVAAFAAAAVSSAAVDANAGYPCVSEDLTAERQLQNPNSSSAVDSTSVPISTTTVATTSSSSSSSSSPSKVEREYAVRMSDKDISLSLYGMKTLSSGATEIPEVRALLSALKDQILLLPKEKNKPLSHCFTPQQLGMCMLGIRNCDPNLPELRALLQALRERIPDSLDAQSCGNILYSMSRMRSNHIEVRKFLAALAPAMENVDAHSAAGDAIDFNHNISTEIDDKNKIISSNADDGRSGKSISGKSSYSKSDVGVGVVNDGGSAAESQSSSSGSTSGIGSSGRVYGSGRAMTAKELANALFGLQGMDSKYPETIAVVKALDRKFDIYLKGLQQHQQRQQRQEQPAVSPQSISPHSSADDSSLSSSSAQFIDEYRHKRGKNDDDILADALDALDGLQNTGGVLDKPTSSPSLSTSSDSSGDASMIDQQQQTQLQIQVQPYEAGYFTSQGIGNALSGLQSMSAEDSEHVRSLLGKLVDIVEAFEGTMTAEDVSNAIFGMQGMLDEYEEPRAVLAALLPHLRACEQTFSERDIGYCLSGMSGMQQFLYSEIDEMYLEINVKIARSSLGGEKNPLTFRRFGRAIRVQR